MQIPYGHCHCGCGELTNIAKNTARKYGWVKGEPLRFVRGHSARRPERPGPNPSGLCLCGCGEATPIAPCSDHRSGHVKGKPTRFVYGHHTRRLRKGTREHDTGYATPCHLFTGYVRDDGYTVAHASGGPKYRHVLVWEESNGPVPENLVVNHLCGVRHCLRLSHLETTSMAGNCRHGRGSTLTEDQVREIRRSPNVRSDDLGAKYGVSRAAINHVRAGRTWKGVK